MAWVDPTARSDGYVVDATEYDKVAVNNPIALRAGAIAIASQAANDVIYASSATQLARLAAGTAGQLLQTNGAGSAPSWVTPDVSRVVNGRLSLTSAVPITTADVTAAGTLYWALYQGNQIGLYSGSAWVLSTIAQLSIAVPAVANQVYDVFVDYNSGTPQLALTAWTNDTTRATALTTQDGVLVLTGTTTKRYVGTVRTVTASQLNDSFALRHVWNYYNRVPRVMRVTDTTDNWNYDSATLRQARATATNQLDVVIGVAEVELMASVIGHASHNVGNVGSSVSIGEDSTTTTMTGVLIQRQTLGTANAVYGLQAYVKCYPAVGRHTYVWLESGGGATTTFYGDIGIPTLAQSGIHGEVDG